LNEIQVDGVEVFVRSEKEYRFVLVMRGEGLNGAVSDSDPQSTGEPPLSVQALEPAAEKTAGLLRAWIEKAQEALKDDHPANGFILRGFAQDPKLPKFDEIYKLKAACVAVYPMYKGVSKLVGMDVLETGADFTPADEFQVVADHWNEYDFFFVHIKPTDSRGEDGNYEGKAAVIDQVDLALPKLVALNPAVLIITGDHSTPAALKSHSWHPVPTLLWAPGTHLQDECDRFGERQGQRGGLGQFPANELMPMAMAHALRLDKYGA
jgi:2,3-bisphosphoglycerate-independent phosphoglycerate mutase